MEKDNANDYLCIRAWDRFMGNYPYYTGNNVQQAREDKAPQDAIYYSETLERWAVLKDVTSPETRWYFKERHPDLVAEFASNWE